MAVIHVMAHLADRFGGQLCVRINNIEHILANMAYFCRKVDDALGSEILGTRNFSSMMQDTVLWLEVTRQEIIDAIITKVRSNDRCEMIRLRILM